MKVNAQSARPFLSLQEATFRLGDRLIFSKSSWVFQQHEHWAIVGPNGSGKSLLADALRGRLPLVQGELRYHFRPFTGLSPEETIGHVSFEERKLDLQDTVVQSRWNSLEEDSTLSVREFLSYERVMDINPFEVTGAHDTARPRFARRQRRAIELLRIGPLLDRRLISLSNGERQRFQLARALCRPLRLLILDEPLVGLDAATREHFHTVLGQLMSTALRVLIITTRPEDLPRQVTHLLQVDNCRIVAAGPRAQIKAFASAPPSAGVSQQYHLAASSTGAGTASSPQPNAPALQWGRGRPHPYGGTDEMRPPSAATPLIELRQVTVRYDSTIILRDIDWIVRPGESWALLGPNGSGKTTLLSLIQGDHPQAYVNHVVVFGRQRGSGESIWELKKQIGWVSPELHLHFDDAATCFEVVASGFFDTIGLFEPPTARQRTATRQGLAQFGLQDLADTPLFALSAGLQRMVLLARALVKKPRLLILDEPCQGLDASHRQEFIATVDALIRSQALTAIYVTHRLEEIPPSIRQVLRLY